MRLITNYDRPGEEVKSIYPTAELVDRLRSYNSSDSLISLDIDGCLRKSPLKYLFAKSFFKPSRWIKHPEWLGDFLKIYPQAIWEKWSKEEIETFSLDYAERNVLPHLGHLDFKKIIREESPSFFPGVKEVLQQYAEAEKIIISRAFREIVEDNLEELGIEKGYHRIDDKALILLQQALEAEVSNVLVFGDSAIDVRAGIAAKKAGYLSDMVLVHKRLKESSPDSGATIFIPRNWNGLHTLLVE